MHPFTSRITNYVKQQCDFPVFFEFDVVALLRNREVALFSVEYLHIKILLHWFLMILFDGYLSKFDKKELSINC